MKTLFKLNASKCYLKILGTTQLINIVL